MPGINSDENENQNGTASAIDEPTGLGNLPKSKPKKKRRPESRHYQTGEGERILWHRMQSI